MNYSHIKNTLEQKNITQSKLAETIGMTREGYSRMIRDKTMKVEVLEKIAAYLQISVCSFFHEKEKTNYKPNDEYSEVNETFNQNKHNMENLIRDLIKENGELKVKISQLEAKLQNNGNGNSLNQTG